MPALASARCAVSAFLAGLRPDPDETVDEFADRHIQLPSYVAESGQWRTARTPFLREIMRCLSPRHPCRKVVFEKPVQIGGTQSAVNWAGYTIGRAPAAMLFYEPSLDSAKRLSKEKLDPMIEATPILRGKVKEARSRDSGNTTYKKEFLGGFLNLLGTNSSVAARSTSAPNVVLDEVDEYEFDVSDQGHPADLIEKRAASFPRYKIFELSTPGVEGVSRIEKDYQKGSRGRYYVPCPFCGHMQHLQWSHLVFTFNGENRPQDAAYQCAGCRMLIPDRYKTWMMDFARARWIHEDPENPTQSFHLNLLYQPYGWAYPWSRLAQEWIEATDAMKAGDPRALKTFMNTILAETWKEKGEKVNQDDLYQRREIYAAPCPRGVVALTAAIDVQDDRLEAEVCGWGVGEESWSIEYRIFSGSPSLPQVWMEVTEWLQQAREHADGVSLRVEAVGIDTGGHHTKEAYRFVERYRGIAYALKGSSQPGAPPIPVRRPRKHRRFRLELYLVGTIALKDTLFPRMKIAVPGPGYMHFPHRPEYNQEYFKGLGSEIKKPKYRHHVQVGYYYQKEYQRNEPLDLKAYNLATLLLWLGDRRTTLEKLAAAWEQITARAKVRQIQLPSIDETDDLPGSSLPVATVSASPSRGRRVISQGVS